MYFYKFNISDYLSHTSHLDELEDLAYRRMLDWYYLHEKPLPKSVDEIAKNIRMRTHCESIANVLREFFTETKNGYENNRATSEIISYNEKSGKASVSAKVRWSKNKNKNKQLSNDANALRTECEGNAKHQTLNTKHQTLTSSTENKFSDDDLKLANFIWQRILLLSPKAKKPNLEKWADTIRVTRQMDNRTHKELQDVFIWANKDSFWQTNILSPIALRKQFDKLAVKLNVGVKNENGTGNNEEYIDNSAAGRVRRNVQRELAERQNSQTLVNDVIDVRAQVDD
jgi:uncharacterized protein YdaU (DUF1376 family)